MKISKVYEHQNIEERIYNFWMQNSFFKSTPDEREPFTIVIPPPNVTGILHMGHMLNNTIQDVLVRRARMLGKNACWIPGTDHASIATEAKVVAKLKKEGINKADISREDFLRHAWDWTDKYGGIILKQLQKLGASCDWERTKFTMDDDMSEAVIKVFIDLFSKGLIYRGYRMVNWDPVAKTTLSDEEVIYVEEEGKLFYINYPIDGDNSFITIATTRPETILGDTAICINPNDARYHHLKGKKVIVPISNRLIPIIEDEYVDIEFGTGCLKITPAHDQNDKLIGDKHKLDVIDILNDDGSLNHHGLHYEGKDRFEVRKLIAEELKEKGYLQKTEKHIHKVGTSERTEAIIEPKISVQWFLKMEQLSVPALENVMNDNIKFYPKNLKNMYRHWMVNIRDWNISRQLWWGHRIPAYYYGSGINDFVVASSKEEALQKAISKLGKNLSISDLKQDPDVLDTWFSSWLWPISVFDGIRKPNNDEINYYYPTNDLVTAPEIIFFWVARMIITGYEYRNDLPFKTVYFTGVVRDKEGKKMSKSLGNSPDPLELIKKYGADGVRVGMLLSSPAGNDLLFDESLCEQGRNFCNKIWNAFRLIKSWKVEQKAQPKHSKIALEWFNSKFSISLKEINEKYDDYRISEVLMTTYKLIWDEFCSWLLEILKPKYQDTIDIITYNELIDAFENLLKLAHPFIPFISEEIWQLLKKRRTDETIMFKKWPNIQNTDLQLLKHFETVTNVISSIRAIRKENNIPNKEKIKLSIKKHLEYDNRFESIIIKLNNISEIGYVAEKQQNCFSFISDGSEYFIPFEGKINIEEELEKINKDLDYAKGFLKKIEKKLSNDRFIQNAPKDVIEKEYNKQKDTLQKIKILEEKLKSIKI